MLSKHRRSRMRAKKSTLRCEALEDRRVLATFMVGDLGDAGDSAPGDGVCDTGSGQCTLRAAIEEANALAGADDISFSVAGTVNLSSGALNISSDLSVDGANSVTVDGGAASRVMDITGGTVSLANLTLTNGVASEGGAINSSADVTLSGVTVSNSRAQNFGGGIFNTGTMALTNNSLVTGNSAGNNNTAFGGGVANYQGSLTIDNSTVSGNSSTQYAAGVFGLQGSVVIQNGSSISDNAVNNQAGAFCSGGGIGMANAMYVANTAGVAPFSLTITDSTVSGNTLYGTNFPYGAGIYSFGFGTVSITNTNITGNMNTGGGGARGGAGFNWPAPAYGPGTLYIDIVDSVIDGNVSNEESGGFGIRSTSITDTVELNISGTTISNNTSYNGAGAAGFLWSAGDDPNSATINIVESTISGNSSGSTGGALEFNNANVTILDSTIDGNSALVNGGGIYFSGSYLQTYGFTPPSLTLTRSTISNNYALLEGGGVYAYDGNVVLDNSTVSGNYSSVYAGGSYHKVIDGYQGTAYETTTEINSSTITNNTSAIGGGVYGTPFTTLRGTNSIISGNTATTGPDINATITPVFTYSLVGDGTDSGLAAGNPDPSGNLVGDAGTPIDAMLGALANNGGSTLTHLPMAGSPAIDAGDPASMGGVDQVGNGRVANGRIDMGSVEVNGIPPTGGCDTDGDGDCDIDDIDKLTMDLAAGTGDLSNDVNGDGVVNGLDLADWLVQAGAAPENMAATGGNPFLPGDFNLDGVVDGQDFIVWNASKFSPTGKWSMGDGNADGVTDGQDFIVWNANKFTSSNPGPITAGGPSAELDLFDRAGRNATGKRQYLTRMPRQVAADPVIAPLDLETAELTSQAGAAHYMSADFVGPLQADQALAAYQAQRARGGNLASFSGDNGQEASEESDRFSLAVDQVLAGL